MTLTQFINMIADFNFDEKTQRVPCIFGAIHET